MKLLLFLFSIQMSYFLVNTCTTGEVRLVNGTTPDQGRVEICINGVWGTVCDDNWNYNNARVVCRQLGYNTDDATYFRGPDHNYGSGNGSIFLDGVRCFGNEYNLLGCLHYPIGSHDCDHSEDVAVSCFLACFTGEVRLANGTTANQGRVEICINGVWGTVCDDDWNYNNARVVCRQLGYNTDGATYFRGPDHNYGSGNGSIFLDGVRCFGNEYNLLGCLHNPIRTHNCDHSKDVAVSCSLACFTGEVRLVNGTTPNQGRVEICINGVWGTVCDDLWTNNSARVVCRQLGYNTDGATYFRGPDHNYGSGTGSIFLDEVQCFGNEYNLLACLHYPIGSHNCYHSEDVAVSCSLDTCESLPSPTPCTIILTVTNSFCEPPSSSPFNLSSITVTTIPITVTATATVESTAAIMSAIILPIILLMIIVLLISLTLIFYYYKIRKAVNRKPVSGKRTSTAKLDNDVVFNIRYNDTNQQISCSQFTSFPLPTILENQVSDGTNDQDYTAMHSSCNHIYEDATKI